MSRRASLQCPTTFYLAHPAELTSKRSKNFRQDSMVWLRSLSNEPGPPRLSQLPLHPPPIPPRPRSSHHRSSQPTLLVYSGDIPLPSPLKHVPSQPIIMYTTKQNSPIRKSPVRSPLASDSGPQSPFNLSANQPSHVYITNSSPNSKTSSPIGARKLPKASEKRILKRCPQSDLAFRFQKHLNMVENGVDASGKDGGGHEKRAEGQEVDPIYLALKQATCKYGGAPRRASNTTFDSASPSPRNLSQVSLQDSGYAETSGSRGHLLGSTPQLDQSGGGGGGGSLPPNGHPIGQRQRPPKLNKQMKSLSLDCADAPPPINNVMRSPFRSKPLHKAKGFANSGETSDWERSVSPSVTPRRLPSLPVVAGTHVVTHEYIRGPDLALFLGDRLVIVDNGDPDWLHGFKVNDKLELLLTFPSTCVCAIQPGEQPMKLAQNVNITESKLRMYRDQVVFAQPDSIRDGCIMVRTETNKFAKCPLSYLMLI